MTALEDKEKQKALLIEIIQEDEKNGMYESKKENMKTGIELIAEERREQIEKHGFDLEIDAEFYQQNELYNAAMYVLTMDKQFYPATWDFWFHDKLRAKEQRMSEQEFWIERMKIAGALLAADIDLTLKDNV